MDELDALEVYYPGGIAGFLEDVLSKDPAGSNSGSEAWLLDPWQRRDSGGLKMRKSKSIIMPVCIAKTV
jgi:hypothetical protein